jgi:MerR family mercuric resistance operon transcriptional regulator
MTEAKLTIGHVARAAGVNVETVRYYQRRGLVDLPLKRARGFRYYGPETATRVRFIKRAQALGMSLNEVRHLYNETRCQRSLYRKSLPRGIEASTR